MAKYVGHCKKLKTCFNLDMECKPLSKHPGKNNGISYQDGSECLRLGCSHAGSKFIVLIISIFGLISVSTSIYCHLQYARLSSELSKQLERVDKLTSEVKSYHRRQQWFRYLSKQESGKLQTDFDTDKLEVNKQKLSEVKRTRRDTEAISNLREDILRIKRDLVLKPATHLHAGSGNSRQSHCRTFPREEACSTQCCFSWKPPSDHYEANFRYIQDTSSENAVVIAIEILRPGFYLVYSQIVVRGREQGSFHPSVGYETVRVNSVNNISKVLMRSYVTQDQRGRRYREPGGRRFTSQCIYPVDTVNQVGMFKLNCNDKLIVRKTEQTNSNAQFQTDAKKSHFGVILINIDSSRIDNPNACI